MIYNRNPSGEYPYLDTNVPLVSPINPNTKLYPTSTRNYFNIDLLPEGGISVPYGYNVFRHGYLLTPVGNVLRAQEGQPLIPTFTQTPNKEVNLQNKILINNEETSINQELQRNDTPSFRPDEYIEDKIKQDISHSGMKEENEENSNNNKLIGSRRNSKKPKLDLNIVNESETGKIFAQSVVNSYQTIGTGSHDKDKNNFVPTIFNNQDLNLTKKEENNNDENIPSNESNSSKTISQNQQNLNDDASVTNISDKSGNKSLLINNPNLVNKYTLTNRSNTPVSKASLNISPRSAFVKMK